MRKGGILSVYVLLAACLMAYRAPLLDWLQADISKNELLLLLVLGFVIAAVPAIPYGIVALAIGAKLGPVTGGLLNLGLSSTAAVVLLIIVRHMLSPEQRERIAGMKGLRKAAAFSEKHPFAVIALARLVPVMPAQMVTIYAAMIRMPVRMFAAATAVGKIPFIAAMTLVGSRIARGGLDGQSAAIIALVYISFLSLIAIIYKRSS